jgi:hypothetical protein
MKEVNGKITEMQNLMVQDLMKDTAQVMVNKIVEINGDLPAMTEQ